MLSICVFVAVIMLSFLTGPEDPVEDMEEVSRVVLLIHLWAEPMIRNEQNIH